MLASKIINLLIDGVSLPSKAAETAVENLAISGGQLFLTASQVDAAILANENPDAEEAVANAIVDFALAYGQSRYHQLSPAEKTQLKTLLAAIYNSPDEALIEPLYNGTLDTMEALASVNEALAVLPADAPVDPPVDPGDGGNG